MDSIHFIHGSKNFLDDIQFFWEKLNKHHELISPYFKDDFQTYTFQQCKEKLLKKYQKGKLHFEIAKDQDLAIGYIISAISEDGVGEIESIFVQQEYQRRSIGDELMRRALAWLMVEKTDSIVIDVAVGNEQVYNFYVRYGFCPRVTRLKYKATDMQ
jgi:ribosomal protein S18 acetylase RimI-like enzyme